MRRIAALLSAACLFYACERTPPSLIDMSSPEPARFLLAVPDVNFRLSSDQRATLSPLLDPDALEFFLARVRPEYRTEIVRDLNDIDKGGPVALGPMTTNIPDAELRAAVAAIFRGPRRNGETRP